MTTVKIELPPKLVPVFDGPARFRGAYGGRGSAKTRSFALMAAVRAYMYSQEGTDGVILCGREFMNSLDESSMAEIKAAIKETGWLAPFFDIGEKYIRTADRRISFVFTGLRHNLDSIKSKARVLIAWVDEAEQVSKSAWNKLLPTVREDGSEVWVTWNPEKDGSETDDRFRKNPPPNSKIVEMNYWDNPWFPETLRQQMEYDKSRDFDVYEHVWCGGYARLSKTQVFSNWRIEEFETPKNVDRFYYGADWGFAQDPTALIRCFIDGKKLYIDYEACATGVELDDLPEFFMKVPGSDKWPITADNARPETISHMQRRKFRVKASKKGKGSVEDGVEHLKSYEIIIHPRCIHTKSEFMAYRYKEDRLTGDVLPVLVDKDNHIIDALRYALEDLMKSKQSWCM